MAVVGVVVILVDVVNVSIIVVQMVAIVVVVLVVVVVVLVAMIMADSQVFRGCQNVCFYVRQNDQNVQIIRCYRRWKVATSNRVLSTSLCGLLSPAELLMMIDQLSERNNEDDDDDVDDNDNITSLTLQKPHMHAFIERLSLNSCSEASASLSSLPPRVMTNITMFTNIVGPA